MGIRAFARQAKVGILYGPRAMNNPFALVWVCPSEISKRSKRFGRYKIGDVSGGDWDKNPKPLSESPVFSGIKQRFDKDLDWHETEYMEYVRNRFETDDVVWGHDSIESFENNRLEYLDKIYKSIESEGYQTQSELHEDQHGSRHANKANGHFLTHEIGCNVSRNGELLFNSGAHRLAIAQSIGLDEIPIQIIVRHSEWVGSKSTINSRY